MLAFDESGMENLLLCCLCSNVVTWWLYFFLFPKAVDAAFSFSIPDVCISVCVRTVLQVYLVEAYNISAITVDFTIHYTPP